MLSLLRSTTKQPTPSPKTLYTASQSSVGCSLYKLKSGRTLDTHAKSYERAGRDDGPEMMG